MGVSYAFWGVKRGKNDEKNLRLQQHFHMKQPGLLLDFY